MSWLHVWPLWAIGAAIFGGLIALAEIGYRGARWQQKTRGLPPGATSDDNGRDYLLTAILGLMALLLGFTFSLALNRFEARRDLVVKEANALETAWMYTRALREPDRAAVGAALRDYTAERVRWSESFAGREAMGATQGLQAKLWAATAAAARAEPSDALGQGLTEAIAESFDAASARAAARAADIPDRVLNVLLLYIALSVVVLGEVSATRDGLHRLSTWLLLALLTLALMIILDLDRTNSGAIMVSQQPLLDIEATLR